MRIVVQRVTNSNVVVDKKIVGKINQGFLVLIGITSSDTKEVADTLINK